MLKSWDKSINIYSCILNASMYIHVDIHNYLYVYLEDAKDMTGFVEDILSASANEDLSFNLFLKLCDQTIASKRFRKYRKL